MTRGRSGTGPAWSELFLIPQGTLAPACPPTSVALRTVLWEALMLMANDSQVPAIMGPCQLAVFPGVWVPFMYRR